MTRRTLTMQLRIRVTNGLREALGSNAEYVFDQSGGTIGRASHNDWILPDAKRYVSSVHASIEAREDGFYLVDTSMNGVYVNGNRTPLGPTAPYRLTDGTRLRMGNYRMEVSQVLDILKADQKTLMRGDLFDPNAPEDSTAFSVELLVEDEVVEPIDLEEMLDDRMASANASLIAGTSELTGFDDLGETHAVEDPGAAAQRSATVHRLPNVPPEPVERRRRKSDAYDSLVRGLGVDPMTLEARDASDVAYAVGQALRETIRGLKEMRANRARSRQQFGMRATQQDVDDLTEADLNEDITDLLLGRGQIYQAAGDNIASVLRALMQHHEALQNAAAAALGEFIDQLDPDEITQRLAQLGPKGKGLFASSRKASLWDKYAQYYQAIAARDADGLPQVAREEFARAYQARLQTLKSGSDD
ncbi:MAG: type VI secretion system-associated FHA domain protein TagH [Pseudomonadota bacterium]